MAKTRNAKRALLLSALSLLMCVSMLVGSTFAWFTDSVTSAGNTIQSGTLDVDLVDENGNSLENKTLEFVDQNGNVLSNILWEPGCTYTLQPVYVKNRGNLWLKYEIVISGLEGDAKLLEAIEWTVEGADLKGSLAPDASTEALQITGHMKEEAGNEYQNLTIDGISITVYATQVNVESDSFGPDYDKNAWVDGMSVYNADDLIAALANEDKVILVNDITSTEVIKLEKDVAINLNGKTLTATILAPNANVTIENGTINATNPNASAIEINAGSLTLNDVDISSARHAIRVDGNAEVVINGGTYKVDPIKGKTQHALNVSGNANVTINGGTFIGPKGTNADSGSAVNVQAGSTVIINGGNFSGGKNSTLSGAGTLIVKGGTFDQNPASRVADGYKAFQSNGAYVVVNENIDAVASTPAELKDALSGAADAGSGDTTVYLANDVDLAGTSWASISVDGYHGAGVITIEGNGTTIKGLNAPLFAGGFAGKSGIVIKNLTIADSNIVSTSGLGGGAFVDTADSMHVITLENCHLVNSTVSGERAGGLIGWCSGYAKLNDGPVKAYVTISNCSVVDSTVIGAGSAGAIAGHPGASDYTYTTIENCVVKNVDVISNDTGSWRTGAIVGTANNGHVVINNVTVEDVTLTQNGVAATETTLFGRFVPAGTGTLVIDGKTVLANATTDGLQSAITSGDADVYLPAGNYSLPSVSNGEVTISGSKNTVITVNKPNLSGTDVTFNNVTVKGSGYSTGVQHVNTVTYNDVTIEGDMCLYGEKVVFNNCTFNLAKGQYIWTYGAKVAEFNNCTFNTAGKALLIYNEGAGASAVKVKGCTFNATAGDKAGDIANQNCAAIEINNLQTSGVGTGHSLITENNAVNGDFSGEWRIKKFVDGNAVVVNDVAYTTIAIDGKLMTIDTNKNVTVAE